MHELGLVKKIVDSASDTAKKADIKNVVILRMRIGKMAGVEPEQIDFLFQTYEKDDCLKDTRLEIEEIPVELECSECGHLFIDERFDDHEFAHAVSHAPLGYDSPPCPKCGSTGPEIIRGRELALVDLEGE